ncbi:MAG: hypothetical protein WCW40_09045 [Bacteroidota bacterium]
MNIFLRISFLVVVLSLAAFAQQVSADSTLTEIERLYTTGQYLAAELESRRMSEQSGLEDSVKVQLGKWIAFSLIAQGKSMSAKERFVALLTIDENFELDPVLTSPKILSVFNDARVRFISQRKEHPKTGLALDNTEQQSITFRTVLFPGWEQMHQGRTSTGTVFISAGIVTISSGLTFELLRTDARQKYLHATAASDIASKYDAYNSYRKAEMYSFAAFAAVYILSEFDIFTHSAVSIEPASGQNIGQQVQFRVGF